MSATKIGPPQRFVKVSVTIPPQLVRLANERVASGRAQSLSALVTRALEHELNPTENELDELFREWIESGKVVVREENLEWARRVLDL